MKVLFYSENCNFCMEILKKINESKIKDYIKTICIDNNDVENYKIKVVPTIIDSDYKEILEGKKAFDYLKNKDFFDFPTNNVLTWKEKEIPDPKIENDKMANDSSDNLFNDDTGFGNTEQIAKQSKENNTLKDVKLNKKTALLLRRV